MRESCASCFRVRPTAFVDEVYVQQEETVDSKINGNQRLGHEVEPIITVLCKGVIEAAHRGGAGGITQQAAYRAVADRGGSLLQFTLFVDTLGGAGLLGPFREMVRGTFDGLRVCGIEW